MPTTLPIYIAAVLLSSCATVGNRPYTRVLISTTKPSQIIYHGDTLQTSRNKVALTVDRKNEPVKITVLNDTLEKYIEIQPTNSFAYWANILYTFGIGMIADKHSPRRYTYPRRIYLNSSDTISEYFKFSQSKNKGELHLHFAIPYINSFSLIPENEKRKSNTGFWGISLGLDYYHSNNEFISLSITGASDFFVPFPAAVDISGEYEQMSSGYLSLSNNHRISRLTIGYGVSYGRNAWEFIYIPRFNPPPPSRDPVKKAHNALGLIFPATFQAGRNFNIGFVYRPTFYRPELTKTFYYEHLMSLGFVWKIRLKK